MSILITHVYSNDNKGDAAILSALISDIKKSFPKSEINILTFDSVRPNEKFEGIGVNQSFMGHALSDYSFKPFKMIYSMYIILLTLAAASLTPFGFSLPLGKRLGQVYELYRYADLVVGVGGGYLRGQPGLISTTELALQLHPLLLSKLLNQKVVLYSQSIGPFGNCLQKLLASFTLPHVDLIIARESITVGILKNMGIEKNLVRSADAAFSFKSKKSLNVRRILSIPNSRKIVGITVRKWLKDSKQAEFEGAVAALTDHFVSLGFAVVFIPQVTSTMHNDDDRVSSREVLKSVKNRERVYVLKNKFDHHEIKSLYSSLDILVGTRFHSVIFALTAFVPVLAIEYEHKTTGIMRDLGLNRWVVKIEDVTPAKLIKLANSLLAEEVQVRSQIRKHVPGYVKRSEATRLLLKVLVGDTK